MKRLILLWFVMIVFVGFSQPDSLYRIIQQANKLYEQSKFDSAIILYKTVINSGFISPQVYYNLGNAYFRQGNIAYAILNYERAYRLDPADENIKHNLAFAQQFIQDKFTEVNEFFLKRWFRSIALSLSADTWAYLSIALFVLTLIMFFVFLFANNVTLRKTTFFIAIFGLLFTVLTLSWSLENKHYVVNSNEAIVIQPSSVRSSPSDQGTELYIIHPGVKVKILSQNDNWFEIKLPNGSIGWMKNTSLEKI